MNTTQQGNLSQQHIILALMEAGYQVLLPLGEGSRYDLVIEKNGKLSKVQCKTGHLNNGRIEFKTSSITRKAGGGHKSTPYTEQEVDEFAVYCPSLNKVFLVPLRLVGNRTKRLRLGDVKRGGGKDALEAEAFELKTASLV